MVRVLCWAGLEDGQVREFHSKHEHLALQRKLVFVFPCLRRWTVTAKKCSLCSEVKSIKKFYVRKSGVLLSECRSCHLKRASVQGYEERARSRGIDVTTYLNLKKSYIGRRILAGKDPHSKLCPHCMKAKRLDEFYRRGNGQLVENCKNCRATAIAAVTRVNRFRDLYGITIAEYDEMFKAQGGVCAICGKPEKSRRISVDHDHATGRARGLLCTNCNVTLGKLELRFDAFMKYLGVHYMIPSECDNPQRSAE